MKETPPSITQIEMTDSDIALAEAAACRMGYDLNDQQRKECAL